MRYNLPDILTFLSATLPELAFINGIFLPIEQAFVSVEDRGFQFADAVYEVMVTYGGTPFRIEKHLNRLQDSLDALGIVYNVEAEQVAALVADGIRRAGFTETLVYLQISRGVASRRHEFPEVSCPTVVMTFKECHRLPVHMYEHGVRIITRPDLRWKRCNIKTVSLLPNVLAKQQASQESAFEVLLIDSEGRVTEGSSTSSFLVVDGVVKTTPLGPSILAGITREVVIEIAYNLNMRFREESSLLQDYFEADEVFLVGTATEIVPVIEIDGNTIGNGVAGPMTRRLRGSFSKLVKS